jgi:hypothetical protein
MYGCKFGINYADMCFNKLCTLNLHYLLKYNGDTFSYSLLHQPSSLKTILFNNIHQCLRKAIQSIEELSRSDGFRNPLQKQNTSPAPHTRAARQIQLRARKLHTKLAATALEAMHFTYTVQPFLCIFNRQRMRGIEGIHSAAGLHL